MDDIFEQCKKRQQEGLVQYGEFDPENDNRCMYTEMEEELLDVINYAYFEILKIRQLKINKIAIEK
tara:strand:- start:479 stop:676 length:198 start_codon:yes stop_codon:yes gene_type:complete